ncbi:protein TPX2-like protein [Carex littledalei]|uniref:Protein TPX2-like protein n=1 Tax=Carex littledalei TaxID=544730 RepID=A0A833RL86_9POAL|nr:protein TPX2-like protein [Carex littledalei]
MVEETTKLLHSPKSPSKQGSTPVTKRSMRNTQSLPFRVTNTNQKQGPRKEQTFTKRVQLSPPKEPREHVYVAQGSPPKDEKYKYSQKEQTFTKRIQGSPEKEPREHAYATLGSPTKDKKNKYSHKEQTFTKRVQGSPEKEPREHVFPALGSPPKDEKYKYSQKEQTFTKRVQRSPEKELREHVYAELESPPKDEKDKYSPKPTPKEKTIKAEKIFRLHSEERALRRASFDYMMSSKINSLGIIKRFEEKIMKVIEEEEIKVMRKEMVPKAQLMPIFDRPFYPQRSARPLTVPKEPSFLKEKCCIGGEFHRHFCFNTKAIK